MDLPQHFASPLVEDYEASARIVAEQQNEHSNRTAQEDFVNYKKNALVEDLQLFNQRLPSYLGCYK